MIFHYFKYILIVFFHFSIILSNTTNSSTFDYITESGKVYMPINVLGHVKAPGTYLVLEGSSVFDILAAASGPLPGSKLNKILLYRQYNQFNSINLNLLLNSDKDFDVVFKPNDTIYIKQTFGSYLMSNSSIVNVVLSIMNAILIFDKIDQ